ncbi:MAG: hypothetical protein K0R03_1363 [Moraxellaceae bacterium]|jgi:hypothetical protein|nr:hypothetical protein [Moraxellaceae bacterium]MDF3030805.1 hypothetical protein [Moraxellaceae bacterium]
MNELDPRQRELADTLRATLEKKAATPDPLLDAALAATRAQIAARQGRPRRHPWWVAGGFAVAASLAVVMVVPFGTGPEQQPRAVAENTPMPDADLQFLQDMDLLVAMEEGRHEG